MPDTSTNRPEHWPESFSLAGEDPSCPHHMTWDSSEDQYICIHNCGRTKNNPPESAIETQKEFLDDNKPASSTQDTHQHNLEETIATIKEAYDQETRELDQPSNLGSCDLCQFFQAETNEWGQNKETGEKINAALCYSCSDKLDRHSRGEEVDFTTELRLADLPQQAP